MHAEQLLLELGQQAGIAQPLRFDAHGCARLMLNEALFINFEHDADADALHIYSALCEIPPQGREALYRKLLEANLFGSQTAGATLAIDDLHHEVVLCRSLALDSLAPAAFVQNVEQFIATAELWLRETQAQEGAPPTAQEASAAVAPLAHAAFLRA